MPSVNLIINAAAGSGKTSRIVREALAAPDRKILITTYTNNNDSEIRRKFYEEAGHIPSNVTIQTWFTFLLEHFVRPYQKALYPEKRVQGLAFVNHRSARGVAEANVLRHYFASGSEIDIYSDKISKFGYRCNERTNGRVIARLEGIFDIIFVDEVQDLAGWDLDVLDLLFNSSIDVTLVGDYRQSTFRTNNAAKYQQFAGVNIVGKFQDWERRGISTIREMNHSHRCNQGICDFADQIFEDATNTISRNDEETGHDGVFVIRTQDVPQYIEQFSPQILRYDRRSQCDGYPAMNFGESKGLGFNRVLIYPHGPLRDLLRQGDFQAINQPSKLYVAVTRARSSVAFVYDGDIGIPGVTYYDFN